MSGCRVGIWTDNPAGLDTDLEVMCQPNIGTAANPLGTVYAKTVQATNLIGDPTLPFNEYLESVNSTGTGTNKLLKSGSSNQTVINTPTGTAGGFYVNDSIVGSWSSTEIRYPKYSLLDGSDKNHSLSVYAAGTVYSLTNVAAALVFGTTSPALVINKAGTYLIMGTVNLEYVGATFAANRTATIKLRRTNNTPADLTGGTVTLGTNIVTTVSGVLSIVAFQPVIYSTVNTDDAITIFGDVSVAPSAGSLDATQASIVAIRLY